MWIKFLVLFIPITAYIFWQAPSFKWKIFLTFGAAIGIFLALIGKSLKGVTPVGRKW